MISLETKIILENCRKKTPDSYSLEVIAAQGESFAYFLRACVVTDTSEWLDFRWSKNRKTTASITFALTRDRQAISLPQSPFGGIWIDSTLSSQALQSFIIAVLEELRRREIVQVRIIQPPKHYVPASDLINYLLVKNGFVQDGVLCHQIFAGKNKLKNFVETEQTKFDDRAAKIGVTCLASPVRDFVFLEDVRAWNQQRGYGVTIDDIRLATQVSAFPQRYFLISAMKDGKPLAHALCVKLLPNSFYYFLAAIDPNTSLKNLGEICVFQLFKLAVEHGSSIIDLGSSETSEGPNHSLMFFKSRFSNDFSNKISWKLQL
jgi:hypothetical protein